MAIVLGDDGTMDTVVYCDECGREYRFNYDGCTGGGQNEECPHGLSDGCEDCYDSFIDDCIKEIKDEHVCNEEED